MSILERPSREHRRRPRRRRTTVRAGLAVLLGVLAFLLGIAFARTLDERPSPGDTVTSIRTLTPLPRPPSTQTVTVTVTTP